MRWFNIPYEYHGLFLSYYRLFQSQSEKHLQQILTYFFLHTTLTLSYVMIYNVSFATYGAIASFLSFLACLRDIFLYGCSRKNTQSPTSKLLSLRCWSPYCFIQFCAKFRLSFKSWRTSCWCSMWYSTAWTFEFSLKDDVMDGGWYP